MDPVDFLLSLEWLGIKFGLEKMTRLCAALGHPERSFQSVIVAGTNGKGSVTAMIAAALHAAGHPSARYTSPHLGRLEERFVIAGSDVSPAALRSAAAQVQHVVEQLLRDGVFDVPPTFFECTTAVAFELFRAAQVDTAVLEVGLGGRLDATNVVTPIAAAITSIDFDHQALLGPTLSAIAAEKAGVVKPGIPVVCGPLPDEADRVIAAACAERGARIIRSQEVIRTRALLREGETIVTLESARHTFTDVRLALRGRHQAANAAVAMAVLENLTDLGVPVGGDAILAGLTRVQWPGRLEHFRWRGTDVLLDAAHNPGGARALAEYLRDTKWAGATLVFGAVRDKDVAGMLAVLLPVCGAVVCTTAPGARAVPADELASVASGLGIATPLVESIADPETALGRAGELGHRVIASGSIFLIGTLRDILR